MPCVMSGENTKEEHSNSRNYSRFFERAGLFQLISLCLLASIRRKIRTIRRYLLKFSFLLISSGPLVSGFRKEFRNVLAVGRNELNARPVAHSNSVDPSYPLKLSSL